MLNNVKIISFSVAAILATTWMVSEGAFADNIINTEPYLLNVYTSGNIGTSANPYGTDFEGVTAAGGSAYFSSFGLNANNLAPPGTTASLYTGSVASILNSEIYNGGIEAGGNISSTNSSIMGSVISGGNLLGSAGTITGSAALTGSNLSSITINGSVSTGQPYTPSLNFNNITNYFKNASSFWASSTPNLVGTPTSGQLFVNTNLQSGLNVLQVDFNALSTYSDIKFTGSIASGAYLVIDILNSGSLGSLKNIPFVNGLSDSNVLFNLPNATSFTTAGSNGSILAPLADITATSGGTITGNFIAQDLYGTGQVDPATFAGFSSLVSAPEPSTYLSLAGFLGLAFLASRKRQEKKILSAK